MLPYSNVLDKIKQIKNGSLSLSDNVQSFLNRIEANKHLNSFNYVFSNEAIERASVIEEKIKSGKHGKLAGMVIGIKDVLTIENQHISCSSEMLKNFKALYTATAVQRLIDEDAIIIGKTNCDEFAMGSSNENSAFGAVLNPHDSSRVPGGSSGGSAAAVAAELCDAALGTDTGGSIRQPASFCGVIGLKPTYGRVSRYGLTAFASSFDSIGPFTTNFPDAALILQVISGKDPLDTTSAHVKTADYSNMLDLNGKKLKIGIAEEYFGEGLSAEVKTQVLSVVNSLRDKGFDVEKVHLPHTSYTIAAYYILTTAEASSNLARYDGARYGFRSDESGSLHEMYINSRSQGFGKEVKRRIMLGTYVLSAGYYDAYYRKAQKVRRLISNDFEDAFKKVDVIITPTSPSTAFKIGEKSADPLEMYLSDIYTTSANLAGIPGISLPIGVDSAGLPIGLQIMAAHFNESNLLLLGSYIKEYILNS